MEQKIYSTVNTKGYNYLISNEDKNQGDICLCLSEVESNKDFGPDQQIEEITEWQDTNNCSCCRKIIATDNPELLGQKNISNYTINYISEENGQLKLLI